MRSYLIPAIETVRRTIDIELAYTISRMRVLERIPGNPIGIGFRPLDSGATALVARHLPSPSFNCVVGLREGDEAHIGALLDWYAGHNVGPQIQIVPGLDAPALGRELMRHGFCPGSFHAAMIADPHPVAAAPAAGVTLEVVTTPEQMEQFLDAYVAGWGIAEANHEQFKANVRDGWLKEPGWTLILARNRGETAGCGTLYIRDKVGYLADAATDPAHRGYGVQAAVLARRMAIASAAGVDFICSGAAHLSGSQRNMVRAGMAIQFVRTNWVKV